MSLYLIEEQSDVFVDACAPDHHAQLLFLSVYGRDTSVQQLLARLHQSAGQGGIDNVTLLDPTTRKQALRVLVGDPKRLEKINGRMPRCALLGNLVNTWIFDPALTEVNQAERSAWLYDRLLDEQRRASEIWRVIQDLSPVPLLADWRTALLDRLQRAGAFCRPLCIGQISAERVELPEDFPQWVSEAVRAGELAVPCPESEATP